MTDMDVDHNPSLLDQETGHKKGFRTFRVVPHSERYVSLDNPMFWERLDQLYGIFEAYTTSWNQANWADCCYTFERKKVMGTLGHLPSHTTNIKELIRKEGLHSLEEFRQFMLKKLPRTKTGLILMPQVNMRHPVPDPEPDAALHCHEDKPLTKKPEGTLEFDRQEVREERKGSQKELPMDEITSLKREVTEQKVGASDPACHQRLG